MKTIKTVHGVRYYNYDTRKYPFHEIMARLFDVKSLDLVHDILDGTHESGLFTNESDDKTKLHHMFYTKLNSGWPAFEKLYKDFISENIRNIFSIEEVIYQTKPTFRAQLPNNIAVGGNENDSQERYGWHKDTDDNYNHPNFEKNFIIPLTNSKDTASVYIETAPGSDAFCPAEMKVGEFFQFNGGECVHGNKKNITGKSRISLDFRIVLPTDYNEAYIKSSKLSKKKFIIGHYYSKIGKV